MSILGALQRQVVLQGAFVKIRDFIKFKGFLVEFLENKRSWENQKHPENRQKSGLFWASPFTMHLVWTLLNLRGENCLQKARRALLETPFKLDRVSFSTPDNFRHIQVLAPLSAQPDVQIADYCRKQTLNREEEEEEEQKKKRMRRRGRRRRRKKKKKKKKKKKEEVAEAKNRWKQTRRNPTNDFVYTSVSNVQTRSTVEIHVSTLVGMIQDREM